MQALKTLCVVLLCSLVYCDLPSNSSPGVDAHNSVRAGVSPAASPSLPPLTWSSTVASYSSSYADNCIFAHSSGSPYGENLYLTSQTSLGESAIVSAVEAWNEEAPWYNIETNVCTPPPNESCGHYTQLAWNTTTHVGCGYKVCPIIHNFGSGPWLIVVCNYEPPGNWNGLRPYVHTTGGGSPPPPPPPPPSSPPPPPPPPPPCSNTCPTGACGSQTICGATVECGSCPFGQYCDGSGSCVDCESPCVTNQCGSLPSPTCSDFFVTCPACSPGETCSNNQCSVPECDTAAACAEIGASCGTQTTSCGTTNCGSCSSGSTCQNLECVPNNCGGSCSSPSEVCNTSSNECDCASGYNRVNGVCTAGSSGPPNYSTDFEVTQGPGAITFPGGTVLAVSGAGETFIRYSRTHSYTVIDPAYTRVKVEGLATTNQGFGVGFRVGQSGGASDGIYVVLSDIGTSSMNLRPRIRQNGDWSWSGGALSLPTGFWLTNQANYVEAVLTTNTTTDSTTVSWSQTTATGWTASSGVTAGTGFAPNTGSIGFWFSNPGGSPGMQRLAINTGSALTISLYDCVDLATWTTMFFQSTGLNPATTSLQTRETGTNAACKAAGAKEAVSGFVLIVESSAVTASVITQNFVSAVQGGSAAVAGLAVKSATVLPSAEAAALAGLVPASVVPQVAVVGGGGGGGAAGLSGGAIAGIVIGSVGGAVLILAVAAIVVAAVVVAAVVVAKKSGDDDSVESSNSKRSSIRQSIMNIFRAPRGGVDVMNNPGSGGHQSITARAPKVQGFTGL